jgi:hypothetical protein
MTQATRTYEKIKVFIKSLAITLPNNAAPNYTICTTAPLKIFAKFFQIAFESGAHGATN